METKEPSNQSKFRRVSGIALILGSLALLPLLYATAPVRAVESSPAQSVRAPSTSIPSRSPSLALEEFPTFFAGIQVNEPDHDRWAAALVAAGFDSVQVTLYARQQSWDGATLYWDREAPWVVSEIRAAQRAGLRVILVMRVALEHGLPENRHLWHGMIWPRDELVADWFEAYGEFVRWGSAMAAAEGVDLFAIGNELNSMTSTRPVSQIPDLYAYYGDPVRVAAVNQRLVGCAQAVLRSGAGEDLTQLDGGRYPDLAAMLDSSARRHRDWAAVVAGSVVDLNRRNALHEASWRALIQEVRQRYDGPLTYGANFDQFDRVGFWDDLDALSVNAYFPLSLYGASRGERRTTMAERWRQIGEQLTATADLPLVMLELGWTRSAGSTVRPYSYDRVEVLETYDSPELTCVHWNSQPTDARERVDAMSALGDAVEAGAFPRLRGFTVWKMTTNPDHRAIEPFAVVLPGQRSGTTGSAAGAELDRIDEEYLAAAARVQAVAVGDTR